MRLSLEVNLGQDTTRIKNPQDAARQTDTVKAILSRMFDADAEKRFEIQLLADEVGMGKTFVALATAYSILQHLKSTTDPGDLARCYHKILIVSPQNSALVDKWQREVSEFVQRCVKEPYQESARRWFSPQDKPIRRIDELVKIVKKPSRDCQIIVTDMGLFTGRLLDYDLKRRILLGCLFKHWGNKFRHDSRIRLLKGAPSGWPTRPDELLADQNDLRLPFCVHDLRNIIEKSTCSDIRDQIDRLLDDCREISHAYSRGRSERFTEIERGLIKLYKQLCAAMISKSFPLVIVDEAHNWKGHKNGFKDFAEVIAPKTRRVLLLTATPFQLRPEEILRILQLSDAMSPTTTESSSQKRRTHLEIFRTKTIEPVLKSSAEASRRFQKVWSNLKTLQGPDYLASIWSLEALSLARQDLREIAQRCGAASHLEFTSIIDRAVEKIDPDERQFFREALRLYIHNADLSHELGQLVIRHRRRSDHRLVRVGEECVQPIESVRIRPDSHILHSAPGLDVRGDGELPHYLLMRCVSEMKNFSGRSSLGSALTGCYSTLLHSSEGHDLKRKLTADGLGRTYLEMLLNMVNEEKDASHPKVREIVDSVLRAWRAGEKSLIFCFRVNTAKRLREIINVRIRKELDERQKNCLGGNGATIALRQRLTSRERDLITLGLDRVLWSLLHALPHNAPYTVADLQLTLEDLQAIARLSTEYHIDLAADRVDRVFLHRVTEHVIARRISQRSIHDPRWQNLIRAVSDKTWVEKPYGITDTSAQSDTGEDASYDERGVHTSYEQQNHLVVSDIGALFQQLVDRRNRAQQQDQLSIFDVYYRGSSLWLSGAPVDAYSDSNQTVEKMHQYLWSLTSLGSGSDFDWKSRLLTMQALRRTLLRDSVLVRLLPERTELEESSWGQVLAQAFFNKMPGQHESMADRINVFLEDLQAAGGSLTTQEGQRHAFLEATKLRDQQFVALVDGSTKADVKTRIFTGFNTPLLPEVLVCTSVGQEGIDLHRHCRHVVHYDLAWNPAVIEQRTGRTDRIGSKTFRERALENDVCLEISVPFLAGTYDERMYEELRMRAQAFEVLTGGDMAAAIPDPDSESQDDDVMMQSSGIVSLPDVIVRDLRVNLHVWSASGAGSM